MNFWNLVYSGILSIFGISLPIIKGADPPFNYEDCRKKGASYQYGTKLICYWIDSLEAPRGSHCGEDHYAWVPDGGANYILKRVAESNNLQTERLYIGYNIKHAQVTQTLIISATGITQNYSNFIDGFSDANTCVQFQDQIWNDILCSEPLMAFCSWDIDFGYDDCRPGGVSYVSPNHRLCYWIDGVKHTSTDACNGNYSVIPDMDAQNVINMLIQKRGLGGEWQMHIGYKTWGKDLDLKTHNDVLQTWANWEANEPDSTVVTCVTMQPRMYGVWDDISCTTTRYSVCSDELPETTEMEPAVYTTTAGFDSTIHTTTTRHQSTTNTHTTELESTIYTTTAGLDTTIYRTTERRDTTTPMPTTAAEVTTIIAERCICDCTPKLLTNNSMDVMKRVKELQINMFVDKETLSSTIRSRTSAPDPRPSSAYLGIAGICVIIFALGLIVVVDVSNYKMHYKTGRYLRKGNCLKHVKYLRKS